MRNDFYQYSFDVGSQSALDALSVPIDKRYEPIQNAWSWENPIREFSDEFRQEMNEWLGTELDRKKSLSIRKATKEFIHFYKDKNLYGLKQSIELAQNTFMFFLRQQRNFDLLARQVLSGYDISCFIMQGIPAINQQYNLEMIYYPSMLMHSMSALTTQENVGPSTMHA